MAAVHQRRVGVRGPVRCNDLTALVLGLDRDSELVAHLFDERDPAVKATLAQAIRAARAAGRKSGSAARPPSDYPEVARFLVEEGIDSISLNPDSVLRTLRDIGQLESESADPGPASRHVMVD